MTKLEQAVSDAEELPPELRELLGEELLHHVHKLLALRDDLMVGTRQLEEGDVIDGDIYLEGLKARYGA